MEEIIEKFLDKWANKDTNTDDVYYAEINGVDFDDALDNLFNEHKDEYDERILTFAGGFHSPGYDIDCGVLSVIIKGKLYTWAINFENY